MRAIFAGVRLEACHAFYRILRAHGWAVDVITFQGARIESARGDFRGGGNLFVLPREKRGALEAIDELVRGVQPALFWSAGLPYILSAETLGRGGLFVNSHPHLLPGHRGANPIRDSAARGETRYGVTTHLMTAEVDAGEILVRREALLNPADLDTIFSVVFGFMEPAAVAETLTILFDRGAIGSALEPARE